MNMTSSEQILYVGIAIIILAVVLAVVSTILFLLSGRRLKNTLEKEYGKPQRYNIKSDS